MMVYIILLMAYYRSPIRDLGRYFRFIVGLDEDDIGLILEQNISNFVTYNITLGNYTIKDISDVV